MPCPADLHEIYTIAVEIFRMPNVALFSGVLGLALGVPWLCKTLLG